MALQFDERLLQDMYAWIDSIPLTRQKKDLKRDFADGALVAEVVKYYHPNLVEIHNYPSVQSITKRTTNWHILNRKVFRRLGFEVTEDLIRQMVTCKPRCAEHFLLLLKQRLNGATHPHGGTPADNAEPDNVHVTGDMGDGLPTSNAARGVKLLGGGGGKADQVRVPDCDRSSTSGLTEHITEPDVKTRLDEKLRQLEATVHTLQHKGRRAERQLEQKDVRIAELTARCRRLEKEHGKLHQATKPPSPAAQQPARQPPLIQHLSPDDQDLQPKTDTQQPPVADEAEPRPFLELNLDEQMLVGDVAQLKSKLDSLQPPDRLRLVQVVADTLGLQVLQREELPLLSHDDVTDYVANDVTNDVVDDATNDVGNDVVIEA